MRPIFVTLPVFVCFPFFLGGGGGGLGAHSKIKWFNLVVVRWLLVVVCDLGI